MQADVERTLGNLHVLAVVSHNDKLMTNDDVFDIYVPTTLRGLMRTWYGERRAQNVQRVRTTVRAGIDFVRQSLVEIGAFRLGPPSEIALDANRLRIETMTLQHHRMVDALRRARGGLTNLVQTYRDDAALASQITLLNEEIADFLSVIESHSPPHPRQEEPPPPRPSPIVPRPPASDDARDAPSDAEGRTATP